MQGGNRAKHYVTLSLGLLLSLLGLLSTRQSFAQAQFSSLDSFLHILAEENRFMGSLRLMRGDELLFERHVGFRDLEEGLSFDEDTKFRIGSVTKTFTSILVLKAIEEGRLSLSDSIINYFPQIRHGGRIQIAHLLRHQSGIHNFTDDPEFLSWNTQAKSSEQMLQLIVDGGNDFMPGTQSQYSNSNYVLLTWILERIYEMPYSDLLRRYILEPLNLKRTGLAGSIQSASNEAKSYLWSTDTGKWIESTETDPSIPLGAGALVSTPAELCRFYQALFGGKLLSSKSLDYMKMVDGRFGAGLVPAPFEESLGYGHTGGIDGFGTVCLHFSESDLTYVFCSNARNFDLNRITIAALRSAHGLSVEMPSFPAVTISEEDLKAYLGEYQSADLPLNLKISLEGGKLKAQATGQAAFYLEYVGAHTFLFETAGVKLVFNLESDSLTLHQGGMEFQMKRF